MTAFLAAAAVGVSFAAAAVLAGPAAELMGRADLASPNFAGRAIPTAVGAVVPAAYGAGLGVLLLAGVGPPEVLWASLAGVFALGLAGLVDDVAGAGEPKGWAGHGRWLRRGRLTAGSFKALIGILAAALAAREMAGGRSSEWPVRAALMALGANAANTLDTRPGRVALGLGLATAVLAVASRWWATSLALPAVGAAAGLLSGEWRQQYMLGDAGALALGFAGAAAWAQGAPLPWATGAAAVLAVLVAVGDRLSLGRLLTVPARAAPAARLRPTPSAVPKGRRRTPPYGLGRLRSARRERTQAGR